MKKAAKFLLKTVKWTFIVFCVFLGSLFFREQRIPADWIVSAVSSHVPSNIVFKCDSAAFGFRRGAENVPFLDAKDGDNYNSLSSLMESFGIEPMLYFYKEEITKEQPLVMDVYEPKADNAEKRAAVIVCHGGAFVASSKDDFTQKTVAYTDSLAAPRNTDIKFLPI